MIFIKHNLLAISSILDLIFLGLTITFFYLSSIFNNTILIILGMIACLISLFLFIGIVKSLCKFALKHN